VVLFQIVVVVWDISTH